MQASIQMDDNGQSLWELIRRIVGIPNDLPFHVGLVCCFPYLKVREGNERLNSGLWLKMLNHLKCHYSISLNFGTEVHAHVTRL